MSTKVLLAYEMNGEPLPKEHGYPLRVVVPGYVGARSVKWHSCIALQETPSDNFFQAHEYKLLPPDVTERTVDYSEGLMHGEMQVNAVTCDPADGKDLAAVPVRGYLTVGGERHIERVDVSLDEGKSWVQADILEGTGDSWAWTLWEATIELGPGEHRIVCRALDSSATTQPATAEEVWNFKGYANNSWHSVRVVVR